MGEANGDRPRRPWLRLALLVALLAAGFVALRLSGLASYLTLDNLQALAGQVRALGWIAPAVYVALWLAACLFFLPGLPLTLLGAVGRSSSKYSSVWYSARGLEMFSISI
ncbi:MAG: hypothetical protein HY794_16785 [Desulfarculus sp.]|nr:hypothetical protein [Desulfarculus sp.]